MKRIQSKLYKIGTYNVCKIYFSYVDDKRQISNDGTHPIQDGGGEKSPPTSFSPVNSTIVGISPRNFLNFSLNNFATLI